MSGRVIGVKLGFVGGFVKAMCGDGAVACGVTKVVSIVVVYV